ncbi:MAG: DUF362 domain-containing protein [Tannerellaceae bacterium]|jgi:uncharacterized protein (DUF362 family)|nr:DUF362 domain-containing protein [Tannerellaceae bacterium]
MKHIPKYFAPVAMLIAVACGQANHGMAQEALTPKVLFALETNAPKGEARGIHPGRVAWAHAPNTAGWDESTGYWFDDAWNKQENCDKLIAQTIIDLTGEKTEAAAWKALFMHFNARHGKGSTPYREGEKIAIKINMNNTYSHAESEEINASPHVVLALLRSLVHQGGVPQKCIALIEPSRYLTDFLYRKCSAEFPDIAYVDNAGGDGRTRSLYTENAIRYSQHNGHMSASLATVIVESDYNINMALLKGHVGQGVTLCGKNWYGATGIHANWRMNHHDGMNQNRDGSPSYITFVDYMGHPQLGEKTLVYFIDGLYGSKTVDLKPSGKWKMPPFNNDWPNSLLASQDGVAIDAVAIDLLCTEFPDMADVNYCDMYLLEASQANNPPSGTVYDPVGSGKRLPSLGVVEHWNNAVDKKYSRNMRKKEGIELVYKLIK